MVDFAREFTHVFVTVGDNDAQQRSPNYILSRVFTIKDAIWPTRVKFAGHMRHRDLSPTVVSNNNAFLSEKLGVHIKSTKLVKKEDLHHLNTFHFNRYGQGYRHMAAMILSVFEEFVKYWSTDSNCPF